MLYKFLADFVLLLHLTFILFVMFGGLLVYKKPKFIWLHIPIVIWGILISLFRWVCPLTPLENYFRSIAGQEGFEGGFINHYIIPLIYPEGFGPDMGIIFAIIVFTGNGIIYGLLIYSLKRKQDKDR